MFRDREINAYERCVKASKEGMPHHYFLTTVFVTMMENGIVLSTQEESIYHFIKQM